MVYEHPTGFLHSSICLRRDRVQAGVHIADLHTYDWWIRTAKEQAGFADNTGTVAIEHVKAQGRNRLEDREGMGKKRGGRVLRADWLDCAAGKFLV